MADAVEGKRTFQSAYPTCEKAHLEAFTLNFSDPAFEEGLKRLMHIYGCVLIKGVLSLQDCKEAESCIDADWQRLIYKAGMAEDLCAKKESTCLGKLSKQSSRWKAGKLKSISQTTQRVRCKGFTRAGKQCARCRPEQGFPNAHPRMTKPLKYGSFCRQHLVQAHVEHIDQGHLRGLQPRLWLNARALAEMGMTAGGLNTRGMAHGSFAWKCRRQPAVRRCFEILYNNTDLCVSLDVPFFSMAREASVKSWPHVDVKQGALDEVFQGILYVQSAEGNDAGRTVVLPGSHTHFFNELTLNKSKAFSLLTKMPNSDTLLQTWTRGARSIPAPAGSLFIWNSRTTHQGMAGVRLAQAISWQPSSRRSEKALLAKQKLCALGLPSTHDASKAILHPLASPGLEPPMSIQFNGLHITISSSLIPLFVSSAAEFCAYWAAERSKKPLRLDLPEGITTCL